MSRSFKKNPSFNPFTSEVRKLARRRANKKIRNQKLQRSYCGDHGYYRKISSNWGGEWLKSWYGYDFKDWITLKKGSPEEEEDYNNLVNDWKKWYKRK